MSAYRVSDYHLNIIVSYFTQQTTHTGNLWLEVNGEYQYLTIQTAPEVAKILMDENKRSLANRYPNAPEMQGRPYQFNYLPEAKYYSPAEIAKAIDCLEYQSCESDDYETTKAYHLLHLMRKGLLDEIADSEGVQAWELQPKEAIAI